MSNGSMDIKAREAAVERVKKLLRWVDNAKKTTDGREDAAKSGEAEVEAFAKMARKLMDEHNLAEHEVLPQSEDARKTAFDSVAMEDALTMARLVELHDKRTAAVAAEVCGCKFFWRTHNYPKKTETIVFYGLPTDLAVCKVFFAELRASIKALASRRYSSKWGTTHREYAAGFVATLLIRVREMNRPNEQCTAIVLCKDGILKRWATEKLNLKTTPMESRKDLSRSDAYWAGRKDGQRFDLGVDRRLDGGK